MKTLGMLLLLLSACGGQVEAEDSCASLAARCPDMIRRLDCLSTVALDDANACATFDDAPDFTAEPTVQIY